MRQALLSVVIALLACCAARAGADTLTVSFGGTPKTYAAAELLARPDAATITIPDDVSYKRAMTYRAVPLLALLGGKPDPAFDTLEARAADGFVSQIPMSLVEKGANGGSVAWVAVEDTAQPWPLAARQGCVGRAVLYRLGAPGTLESRHRAVAVPDRRRRGRRVPGAPLAADGR